MNAEKLKDYSCREIIIIGPRQSGKSSILNRFIYGSFNPFLLGTVTVYSDYKKIKDKSNSITSSINVYEIPGDLKDNENSLQLLNNKDIILVFNINDIKSFNSLYNWLENHKDRLNNLESLENKQKINKMILANKSDLGTKISKEDIQKLCKILTNSDYQEISTKTGVNFNESFNQLLNSNSKYQNVESDKQEVRQEKQEIQEKEEEKPEKLDEEPEKQHSEKENKERILENEKISENGDNQGQYAIIEKKWDKTFPENSLNKKNEIDISFVSKKDEVEKTLDITNVDVNMSYTNMMNNSVSMYSNYDKKFDTFEKSIGSIYDENNFLKRQQEHMMKEIEQLKKDLNTTKSIVYKEEFLKKDEILKEKKQSMRYEIEEEEENCIIEDNLI